MAKKEKVQPIALVDEVKQEMPEVVEKIVIEDEVPTPVIDEIKDEIDVEFKKELVEEFNKAIVENIVAKTTKLTAFDVVGEDYPWAWNMSNVSGKYWFSCIDASQHAELKSDADSDFKKFVVKLMKESGMPVVVREPRNSMFVHVSKDGIQESTVVYL
ncbi:hypothetical protein AsFcp4_60 [Aeromonas phage AsFcp_4]|nr:hypothetical protein ASfcp2_147 [Aeromonas phage AsFcp_2]QAX99517.1 hypothetical protein AsFcp4_60 [Aeromonas phage AsFcp_4]